MLQRRMTSLALQYSSSYRKSVHKRYRRGRPNSGYSKGLICRPVTAGSWKITLTTQVNAHCMQLREVSHQIHPGNAHRSFLKPPVQINLHPQRQKTRHDMPNRGIIAVMEDRPYLQRTFLFPENPFHSPQSLVSPGYFIGRKFRVGGEHKLSIKPGISLNCFLINMYRALLYLQKPGKPFVAYHCLGA